VTLPVEAVLPELVQRLGEGRNVVLEAPPGAGKTTRVPLALLAETWLRGRSILMLEPRRLAARGAAARLAALLGEPLGQTVGFRIRFESRIGRQTRIEVVTEGILTRRLQQDPTLEGVGLVIFDEFHERHLHSDLALALCLDAQSGLRDDLRLLVMSATLYGALVAQLIDAEVVRSEGRQYPVTLHHTPRDPEGRPEAVVAAGVVRALGEQRGDILAFLPGGAEIRRAHDHLLQHPACAGVALHMLYGDLPFEVQQRAIEPDAEGRRKVVLATPIAETSLTIEGITTVVDGGWQRAPRFDPRTGLSHLETLRVSRASAEQRAGRAGRLQAGVAYRLWGENTQRGLRPFNEPEIGVADLAPLALELTAWGVSDPGQLRWLDPPPAAPLAQARELLLGLGALDEGGRITAVGREMAELPLHPRLAHMLLEGRRLGLAATACDIAALVAERDLFRGSERARPFGDRLEALTAFRQQGREGARRLGADPHACGQVERAARQWRSLLRLERHRSSEVDEEEMGLLLALAYPDRIARLREGGDERYLLSSGRGARLLPHSPLRGRPLLVAVDLDGQGEEATIRLAAPLSPALIRERLGGQLVVRERVAWDGREQAVVARREECFGALVLASKPLPQVDAAQVQQAMLTGIAALGVAALPWEAGEAQQLRARVASLRAWLPEQGWPDWSDAALQASLAEWLAPFLPGISRREQLARLDLTSILLAQLDYPQQRRLEELAPTHLAVPSGARHRLEYRLEGVPVLAVKLQELFGLAETPRVAAGRVAVLLHLLSPARRPVQVTQDLANFWATTYKEVCKELKGRYPKHPWPDDPWSARPTAATMRRLRQEGR